MLFKMTNNVTFLLSQDYYVYGVLTTALDLFPFNLIKRMVVNTTYLYGIQTYCVLATSKDIEDFISLTTNSVIKPLFLKRNTSSSMITTQYDKDKENTNCYIDTSIVSTTTQNILEQYDNIMKANVEDEFKSFCNDFVQDCQTLQLIDKTFEEIQDADMMIQCSNMLNDCIEERFMD
jgi:uncharacterized membrane protein YheB (UPF0754 family)